MLEFISRNFHRAPPPPFIPVSDVNVAFFPPLIEDVLTFVMTENWYYVLLFLFFLASIFLIILFRVKEGL